MDSIDRLKQLAGIQLTESDLLLQQLSEVVQLEGDLSLDDVQRRMDACKRALGIANTLPDPADKKKWVIAVFVNMNKIRAALSRIIKTMQ